MRSACRLCLAKDCTIKSIFAYEDQKSRHNDLQALIKEATGIQVILEVIFQERHLKLMTIFNADLGR